jgi:hypothetical protein
MRTWTPLAAGLLAITLFLACDDTQLVVAPLPTTPLVARLVSAKPTALLAQPGASLAPVLVTALDSAGRPMAGVPINFTVVAGNGWVVRERAFTDAQGQATPGRWQLSEHADEHILIAWADRGAAAAFLATDTGGVTGLYGLVAPAARSGAAQDTLGARYTLFDDGRFSARAVIRDTHSSCKAPVASCMSYPERTGSWTRTDATVLLEFDGASSPVQGMIQGDALVIDGSAGGAVFVQGPPPPSLPVVFDRASPHSVPAGVHSRYLLFEDEGEFALQYGYSVGGPANSEYAGRFSRSDDSITFLFDGWSMAGPWQATGTLCGDTLIVRYNTVMILSDFEDGTYIRHDQRDSQHEPQPAYTDCVA